MQSVPSVAVQVGGVGEVVKNELTGQLIPTHDTKLFNQAIVALINQPERRKEMGKEARSFVLANYSLAQCLHHFEELYNNLLKEKR
jgi:glycosyltransferase involved in cell wall biosynthesis